MKQQHKQERVEFRTSPAERKQFEMAATFLGVNLSAFLRNAALSQATEILKQTRSITLSDRDRDAFLNALENPPKANKKLKKAIAAYKLAHE